MKRRHLTTYVLVLGLLALFTLGLLGTAYTGMEMYAPMSTVSDMGETAPMGGCLFTGILHPNTSCGMSAFAHIEAWQNMLSALPAQKSLFLFFALLFSTLVMYMAGKAFGAPRAQSARGANFRGRSFGHTIFDRPLQEAFSNGILNPKIF